MPRRGLQHLLNTALDATLIGAAGNEEVAIVTPILIPGVLDFQ